MYWYVPRGTVDGVSGLLIAGRMLEEGSVVGGAVEGALEGTNGLP